MALRVAADVFGDPPGMQWMRRRWPVWSYTSPPLWEHPRRFGKIKSRLGEGQRTDRSDLQWQLSLGASATAEHSSPGVKGQLTLRDSNALL